MPSMVRYFLMVGMIQLNDFLCSLHSIMSCVEILLVILLSFSMIALSMKTQQPNIKIFHAQIQGKGEEHK